MILFIRLATAEDLDTFVPFFENSLRSQFSHYSHTALSYFVQQDYSRENLEKGIARRMQIFLAFDGSNLIGYLMTNKHYGGVAFANWFAVHTEYHGQGVGSSLLSAWEKSVLDDGGHKLLLWTTENNLDFYSHRGFTVCGHMPDGYFGVDDYVLYKTLRPSEEGNYLHAFLKGNE